MAKKSSAESKAATACSVFSYSTNPFDFEIGGRNQITQLCLKLCAWAELDFDSAREVLEGLEPRSFTCFSAVGVLPEPMTLPKSSAPPGVFGVFADDPKEANAPEPRPKALDAFAVGEARAVVEGDMAMPPKGFLLLWEDESACRRPGVKFRAGCSLEGAAPFVGGAPVDRESLLVLRMPRRG